MAAHFPQEWKVTAALAPVRQRPFPCSYEMPAPPHAAPQPSRASCDTAPSVTRVPGGGTAHDPAPGEAELRAGKPAGKGQVTDLRLSPKDRSAEKCSVEFASGPNPGTFSSHRDLLWKKGARLPRTLTLPWDTAPDPSDLVNHLGWSPRCCLWH